MAEKPALYLIGGPPTPEDIFILTEKLTGKKPTPWLTWGNPKRLESFSQDSRNICVNRRFRHGYKSVPPTLG